jgi:hypothetical protein
VENTTTMGCNVKKTNNKQTTVHVLLYKEIPFKGTVKKALEEYSMWECNVETGTMLEKIRENAK